MKTKYLFAPACLLTIVTACGSSSNSDVGSTASDQIAQVSVALSGGDFSGNSVRICGSRPAPDSKYRCDSFLTPPDAGTTDCPCFNFNADGSLVALDGGPAVITGLCPSVDFPSADWTFNYFVFPDQDCAGDVILNDGTHNFTCFDSHDIGTQANPNASVEALAPGLNINHILCTTENASKEWFFQSCAVATTAADTAAGNNRFDCGCTEVAGACDCGDGGVTDATLEAGCTLDLADGTCNIICPTSEQADAGSLTP